MNGANKAGKTLTLLIGLLLMLSILVCTEKPARPVPESPRVVVDQPPDRKPEFVAPRNPLLDSPEGVAIDAYLTKRPTDPAYEVVKWTPPVKCTQLLKRIVEEGRVEIAKTEAALMDIEGLLQIATEPDDVAPLLSAEKIQKIENFLVATRKFHKKYRDELGKLESAASRFCRLKYQAKHENGDSVLHNTMFIVENGKAVPVFGHLKKESKHLKEDIAELSQMFNMDRP
jgi:hypothetical protein